MTSVIGTAVLIIRARDRRFRHTNRELSDVKRRLHQGLSAPGISIFSVDRTGTVSWFAGRPIPRSQLSMSSAVGAEAHDLLSVWPEWLDAVRSTLRGESRTVAVQIDDTVLDVACAPLRDDDAQVTEALIVVTDNTEGHREAERAERLAQMRSRALATINHKLRGQLNGMLGISELLGTTSLTEQQAAWNEIVTSSGHQLLKFVHHLVDFMELDAERFEALREPFSLRERLDTVVSNQRARADEDETALTVRYPLELSEHFSGDGEEVEQILELLIAVALGTNAGGEVLVNVDEAERDIDESMMVITVEDHGRGLTPESLARVFDGLESPAAMWSIRSGGTGLELPIARLLARAMGGDLTVESRVNIGTTLRVELPLARATLSELATQAPTAGADDRVLRILLVDDSAIQSRVAGHLLRQLGHRVTTASHGAEAIELLDANAGGFDVMLTELHMPVLDGFAATAAVRERVDQHRDLPIIAVTSDTRRTTRLQALDAGFDAVLEKPLDLGVLRAGLASVGERPATEADDAGTPSVDDPVIHEAALDRLHELDPDGSDQLAQELVSAFLEATPRQLLEARDAALSLSSAQLEPIARSITTSCRLLGARRLERRTAAVVRAVEARDLGAARLATDALTAEFAIVKRALAAAISSEAA